MIYIIVETAKTNGAEPFSYLQDRRKIFGDCAEVKFSSDNSVERQSSYIQHILALMKPRRRPINVLAAPRELFRPITERSPMLKSKAACIVLVVCGASFQNAYAQCPSGTELDNIAYKGPVIGYGDQTVKADSEAEALTETTNSLLNVMVGYPTFYFGGEVQWKNYNSGQWGSSPTPSCAQANGDWVCEDSARHPYMGCRTITTPSCPYPTTLLSQSALGGSPGSASDSNQATSQARAWSLEMAGLAQQVSMQETLCSGASSGFYSYYLDNTTTGMSSNQMMGLWFSDATISTTFYCCGTH
jgi:hypothetical protein